MFGYIAGRVGKLGEDHDLVVGMFLAQQAFQLIQLRILIRFPLAAEFDHLDQLLAIFRQLLLQSPFEITGVNPGAVVLFSETFVITLRQLFIAIYFCGESEQHLLFLCVPLVCFVEQGLVAVFVFYIIVSEDVLVANRKKQFVLDRINKEGVAQDMSIDRQQESIATAVYALEEGTLAEATVKLQFS